MGMFDYIEDELNCIYCGFKQNGFQTKDMECMLNNWKIKDLAKYSKYRVIEVHTVCKKCKKFVSINLELDSLKTDNKKEIHRLLEELYNKAEFKDKDEGINLIFKLKNLIENEK